MPVRLLYVALALSALVACEPARSRGGGGGSNRVFVPGDGGVSSVDGGAADAGAVDAGFVPGRDAGFVPGRDGGFGPGRDAGFPPGRDAGFPPPRDAGTRDGGPPAGNVGLSFVGCTPDFGGEIVVSYNGSIAIGSVRNHVLTSSLQFDLNGTGTDVLSSQHRIQTGEVINLVIGGTTWTNISTDADVITGNAPDPIGGTLVVTDYAPSAGRIDAVFTNVTLADTQAGSVCRINGTATATRLAP